LAQVLPAPAFWFKRFSEQKCKPSGDARTAPTQLARGKKIPRGNVLAIRSLVVKHVDAAELRIVASLCIAGT
jgi:hypothetical protein